MAIRNKWHIILGRTDGSDMLNTSFSKYLGVILIGCLAVFTLLVIASAAFIIRWHTHFPQIEQVQAENKILRNEIDRLVTEIDSISFRLEQMKDWEDELRLERNLEPLNRDISQMGTGGLPVIEANYPQLDKDINLQINLLWQNVKNVSLTSSYAFDKRQRLLENMSLQQDMYQYTPSVYPAFGRITTPYGWRTHPITGRRDFHSGIDIANGFGSPVYATAHGTIKEISYNRYYGHYLIISHKFGYETMYAHLHTIETKRGERVERGDIIATMGSSGRSTGPHLHYEVRRYRRHVNPYPYLNKMVEDIAVASN